MSTETTETFDLESAIAAAATAKREREEAKRREQEEREHKEIADAIGQFSKSLREELPREMMDALGAVVDYDQEDTRPLAFFERHGKWEIRRVTMYGHPCWRVMRPDHVVCDFSFSEGMLLTHLLEMLAEWDSVVALKAEEAARQGEQPEPEPTPAIPAAPAEPQITILENGSNRRTVLLDCDGANFSRELLAANLYSDGDIEIWGLTGDSDRPEVSVRLQKTIFRTLLFAVEQWQAEQDAKMADGDDIPF